MDSFDERHLLENLGRGNEAAFWPLWREHRPHLYEVCARMTGASDADDALSRSMLLARAKLPAYAAEIVNLEAWLTRLAGNVCRDILREQRRSQALPAAQESSPQPSPEEEYGLVEIRAKVDSAIAGLHPRLRGAARLYFVEEQSYAAIAEQLRITNANARKRVQQARAVLRRELKELHD